MSRRILRSVAKACIGLLLFMQMAVAAYACPSMPSMTAQMSMMDSTEADLGSASTPVAGKPVSNCEDMAVGMMDPQNPNLCAEHCKYGQQSDHASTLTVPAVLLLMLYVTPMVPIPVSKLRPAVATTSALVAASPPHTILHCCFRI